MGALFGKGKGRCRKSGLVLRFARGHVSDAEAAVAQAHLRECAPCRARIEDARTTTVAPPSLAPDSIAKLNLDNPIVKGDWGSLGGYRVLKELGSGGMGMVLLAFDTVLERHVALKIIKPELVWDGVAVARFLNEAKVVAKLQHENVVTIHQISQHKSIPFIVMEYIEGQSLADLLKEQAPLPEGLARGIIRQVLLALDAAHGSGIIHRDVKPGNVLLDASGQRAKLSDFGLARKVEQVLGYTDPGRVPGTIHYMSPEQVMGITDLDGRSDLFSAGVVLYQMLTGALPFPGKTENEVVVRIWKEDPEDPHNHNSALDPSVVKLLYKALEKDRGKRFSSAREFIEALEALDAPPVEVPPDVVRAFFELTNPRASFGARLWTQLATEALRRDIMLTPVVAGEAAYHIGDCIVFYVEVERDCFVTAVNMGTSGATHVLLQDYPLCAGRPAFLPGSQQQREWLVGGPPGGELVRAFFTLGPVGLFPGARPYAFLGSRGQEGELARWLAGALCALKRLPEGAWCQAACELTVLPAWRASGQPAGLGGPNRVDGVGPDC